MMLRGATARSLLILDEFGKGKLCLLHSGELADEHLLSGRHITSGWSGIAHWDLDGICREGSRLSQNRQCIFFDAIAFYIC